MVAENGESSAQKSRTGTPCEESQAEELESAVPRALLPTSDAENTASRPTERSSSRSSRIEVPPREAFEEDAMLDLEPEHAAHNVDTGPLDDLEWALSEGVSPGRRTGYNIAPLARSSS